MPSSVDPLNGLWQRDPQLPCRIEPWLLRLAQLDAQCREAMVGVCDTSELGIYRWSVTATKWPRKRSREPIPSRAGRTPLEARRSDPGCDGVTSAAGPEGTPGDQPTVGVDAFDEDVDGHALDLLMARVESAMDCRDVTRTFSVA